MIRAPVILPEMLLCREKGLLTYFACTNGRGWEGRGDKLFGGFLSVHYGCDRDPEVGDWAPEIYVVESLLAVRVSDSRR